MDTGDHPGNSARFILFTLTAFLAISVFVGLQRFQASGGEPSMVATYSYGLLHLTIPYDAHRSGNGQLTIEVLDPEDDVVGRVERHAEISAGHGRWQDEIKLEKALPLNDLVWHRVRYRFKYDGGQSSELEGTESISQILRTPVIHIMGQQSYLSGGQAAIRVIVTDSKNEIIPGRNSLRIDLLAADKKPRALFAGRLNRRGTTEPQFLFPSDLAGSYKLRYAVDTPIGATEFTQDVRLEDKVSILLTTEKPIYQPGQTIHVRALALDRSDHEAAAKHKLTFELEDSRGNKVFKKATETDQFGVASAEFGWPMRSTWARITCAPDVRYRDGRRRRAHEFGGDCPKCRTICAAKFKVAVEFGENGKQKRGYQPGDHVTGVVRANYFFGKPVDHAEISIKASAMDVAVVEVASRKARRTPTAPIVLIFNCRNTLPGGLSARGRLAC
jgi:hypothetical protein